MKTLNIIIIIVSDTRTTATDKSGKTLKKLISKAGHNVVKKLIVPDDIYQIRHVVSMYIAEKKIDVIITSGGTGITGRDGTPEAVSILLDKKIEGFGEIFRALSYQKIKSSSIQTRALAGVANSKFIFVFGIIRIWCFLNWDSYKINVLAKETLFFFKF